MPQDALFLTSIPGSASERFPLLEPGADKEIRVDVVVQKTKVSLTGIGTDRFKALGVQVLG